MKSIIKLMEKNGVTELDFVLHRTKPTVTRNGSKYEILSIYTEDGVIILDGIKVSPGYEFKLIPPVMDSTWRKTSIDHIKNIVNQEINRLYK